MIDQYLCVSGWPKFAHMSVFESETDGGVAVAIFAPMQVKAPSGKPYTPLTTARFSFRVQYGI